MPAAANVINFSNPRRANEFNECFDKIETVDVIPHSFPFVSEDPIRPIFYCADHQVRKETMQVCAMCRPSETTAAKRNGRHLTASEPSNPANPVMALRI